MAIYLFIQIIMPNKQEFPPKACMGGTASFSCSHDLHLRLHAFGLYLVETRDLSNNAITSLDLERTRINSCALK